MFRAQLVALLSRMTSAQAAGVTMTFGKVEDVLEDDSISAEEKVKRARDALGEITVKYQHHGPDASWQIFADPAKNELRIGDIETFYRAGEWHNRMEGAIGVVGSYDSRQDAIDAAKELLTPGHRHLVRSLSGSVASLSYY